MITVLDPSDIKKLHSRKFSTLPIVRTPMKQYGAGCQCGGNIFDSIASGFSDVGKAITSNPLRAATAIGTLGMSETFLAPAQLIGKAAGVKPSVALAKATPVIGFVGSAMGAPDLGKAAGLTSKGLKMLGQGKKRRRKKR